MQRLLLDIELIEDLPRARLCLLPSSGTTTVEILHILTDKLSSCSFGKTERAEFYQAMIVKVLDSYYEEKP